MMRIYADQYIALGERIAGAKIIYQITQSQGPDDPGCELNKGARDGIGEDLAQIQRLCNELDLPTSFKLLSG
jgi:hypothetical protein